ncbi:MAG: hypothetical protein AAB880_00045 [Patescibacteria group bacterium]
MNNAIINIRSKTNIKKKAKKKAERLGLSLSGVLNGLLQDFVATKDFHISLEREEPSAWLKEQLAQSEADEKAGRVYSFDNIEDNLAFLKSLRNKK